MLQAFGARYLHYASLSCLLYRQNIFAPLRFSPIDIIWQLPDIYIHEVSNYR
jgi:hypothetical protein